VGAQFRCELQLFPTPFPVTKNDIRERTHNTRQQTHNTQQHQRLLTTGLNAGAARISRKYIFLNRSSSSFIARLRKGDDGIWKTVRVSVSGSAH
jgi:hypothetical protein